MSLLAILVTHLDAQGVMIGAANLQSGLPPGSRVVVAHGGRRRDYDAVPLETKLFVDDEGLRGAAASSQSYNSILQETYDRFVRPDPDVDHVLLVEFDQIVLRPDFGERLLAVLQTTRADFLGKNCVDRTATNWWHRIRYRHDRQLLYFLHGLSIREEPTRIFGCLGSGFVMRRRALEAFSGLDHLEGVYNELYIPTVMHHLGFRLADVDAVSDLYDAVRWTPPYSLREVEDLRAAGASVVHPFKEIAAVARLMPPAG